MMIIVLEENFVQNVWKRDTTRLIVKNLENGEESLVVYVKDITLKESVMKEERKF